MKLSDNKNANSFLLYQSVAALPLLLCCIYGLSHHNKHLLTSVNCETGCLLCTFSKFKKSKRLIEIVKMSLIK